MPPTCFLHVPDPDDQPFDDDEPNKPIAPGDRWCSLWAPREPGGPRLPCHPSIEGTADEWLLIAGAIEAGAPRAFGRVAFAPAAGGGELWSPHNSTGDRDHVRLTTADLLALAADIRARLAPADRDVIASAPRPTIADQPPRAIATDAELNEASNCGWAEATIDGGDQEARSLRAVADLIASRLTPPTLPADLRGLLDDLVAAKDAIDAVDLHDLGHILRLDAYEEAVRAVAEWHRGAGGGR